jgi:arsenate reductase (thioredoxin)
MSKVKILFMCVANSARSQMAEGLARQILGHKAWVESAGSHPKTVNPLAIQVMQELNIDISNHNSKSTDQINLDFMKNLDFIITLCSEEVCPVINSPTGQHLKWLFNDPGTAGDTESKLESFRQVRDLIKAKITAFSTELSN